MSTDSIYTTDKVYKTPGRQLVVVQVYGAHQVEGEGFKGKG